MGWSDFLSKLAGNNPSDDDEPIKETSVGGELFSNDFDRVVVDELPPGELSRVKRQNGKYILIVDVAQADPEDWDAAKAELQEEFANAGGISVETASPIVSAYRSEEGQKYIKKVYGFYEDKIPPRILTMIQESLVLRLATESNNLSFEEVRKRKRQIAKYGDEGFAISSLCSAGYLDEDRFFWNLYGELVSNGSYTTTDYEEIFLKIVRERPFVVFVKIEDSPQEVYDDVLRKSIQHTEYNFDIEFIDVRGMGEANRGTIRRTIDMFKDHHEGIDYDTFETDQELVIRIKPDSL